MPANGVDSSQCRVLWPPDRRQLQHLDGVSSAVSGGLGITESTDNGWAAGGYHTP